MVDAALLLFQRLGCRDYARFDFRADPEGRPKLLEVNPNPGWCWDGKLNLMAELAGWSYPDLLRRILEVAQERVVAAAEDRYTGEFNALVPATDRTGTPPGSDWRGATCKTRGCRLRRRRPHLISPRRAPARGPARDPERLPRSSEPWRGPGLHGPAPRRIERADPPCYSKSSDISNASPGRIATVGRPRSTTHPRTI
jgi:hypothetical protein